MLDSCLIDNNVHKFTRDNIEITIQHKDSGLRIEVENFDTSKFYATILNNDDAKTLDDLLFTNLNGLQHVLIEAFTAEDESISVQIDENAKMHFKWIVSNGQKERRFYIELKERILSPPEKIRRQLSSLPSCSLEQKRILSMWRSMLELLEAKDRAGKDLVLRMGALERRTDGLEEYNKIRIGDLGANLCVIQENQQRILKLVQPEEIFKAKNAQNKEDNQKKNFVNHCCNKENETGNETLKTMLSKFKDDFESSIEQVKSRIVHEINQELNRPGPISDVYGVTLKEMIKQEIDAMRQDQEEKYAKLLFLVHSQGDELKKFLSVERRLDAVIDNTILSTFQQVHPTFKVSASPYLQCQNSFRDVESEKGKPITQAIFGEKALPKTGKYYFSVKIKNFERALHNVLAVGITVKKSEDAEIPVILSDGGYFINLFEKITYLSGEMKNHRGDPITLGDVVHVLVDREINTIFFKVNEALYYSGKIDAKSFGDEDIYPCVYSQMCTDLKFGFV